MGYWDMKEEIGGKLNTIMDDAQGSSVETMTITAEQGLGVFTEKIAEGIYIVSNKRDRK